MANGLGFVDPTAGGGKETVPLAPRPAGLSGTVVGLLENTKEQADIILKTIGGALFEHYGGEKVVIRRQGQDSGPDGKEMIDEMADQVDVAIAGLGG